MRILVRVLASLIAGVLGCLIAIPATLAATAPPPGEPAYSYDAYPRPELMSHSETERGPPALYPNHSPEGAVDCSSARSDADGAGPTTTRNTREARSPTPSDYDGVAGPVRGGGPLRYGLDECRKHGSHGGADLS